MSALVEQSAAPDMSVCNRAAASWSGILVASPIQRKNSARGRLTPAKYANDANERFKRALTAQVLGITWIDYNSSRCFGGAAA